MRPIILLDLNYTFVSNSVATHMPGRPDLENEQYRAWLIPLFEAVNAHVIMVTVRSERLRKPTLARIERLTGWLPHEAHFKPAHLARQEPPDYKQHVFYGYVLPERGNHLFLALESNPATRKRYREMGVRAIKVPDLPWSRLPSAEPLAAPMTLEQPQLNLVVLLDLNFTLVANSLDAFHMVKPKVSIELYRNWLVTLMRPFDVVLMTSRLNTYQHVTMHRIMQFTNWTPAAAYFKPVAMRYDSAEVFKQHALRTRVFDRFGMHRPYLALESNEKTRDMYAQHGIKAVKVRYDTSWTTLPPGTLPDVP